MELILFILSIYFVIFLFALLRETTFNMVFSLILVFLIACILLFNFQFYFLGFVVLIIYLGAIAVLFLFMVMLFDRSEYKIFSLQNGLKNKSYKMIIFCFLISFLLSFSFFFLLNFVEIFELNPYTPEDLKHLKLAISLLTKEKIQSLPLFLGVNTTYESFNIYSNFSDAELIGFDLYLKYFFLLLMSGLGLLIAMIGCIIITKSSFLDKFERKNQQIETQLSRFKI